MPHDRTRGGADDDSVSSTSSIKVAKNRRKILGYEAKRNQKAQKTTETKSLSSKNLALEQAK